MSPRRQRVFLVALSVAMLLLIACGPAPTPAPERLTVEVGTAPALGPADAKVVLVEFGDFQCSHCAAAEATLAALRRTYADSLRVVFKQFPLAMHPDAALAAEASLAADAQGCFWAYHDRLFASGGALARADLERLAAGVVPDLAAFRIALDEHRFAAAVQADSAQGMALGVTGTPAFFVNGRLVLGAVPYATLSALVEDELHR